MNKKSIEDLACFGGTPEFENPLHVGRPNIGDKELFLKYVDDIFESRWLTNEGKYSLEFERAIEEKIGVKHCIATCNGTIAGCTQQRVGSLEIFPRYQLHDQSRRSRCVKRHSNTVNKHQDRQ